MSSSIKGYGFSVWYVPNRWRELQLSHGIRHVPHVTFTTGKSLIDAQRLVKTIPATAKVLLHGTSVEFPSMYEIDPLKAFGWYATLLEPRNLMIPLPHMSIGYFVGENLPEIEILPPTDVLICHKCVADTRSNDPTDWYMCLE